MSGERGVDQVVSRGLSPLLSSPFFSLPVSLSLSEFHIIQVGLVLDVLLGLSSNFLFPLPECWNYRQVPFLVCVHKHTLAWLLSLSTSGWP